MSPQQINTRRKERRKTYKIAFKGGEMVKKKKTQKTLLVFSIPVTYTMELLRYYIMYSGGLVPKSCPTLATPWSVTRQAPLSMGFSRQKYWSKLPFPSPGDLADPETEPRSPALQRIPALQTDSTNCVSHKGSPTI